MAVLRIKDEQGNWISIKTIKGEKGDSYILTEQDKEDIAEIVSEIIEIPDVSEFEKNTTNDLLNYYLKDDTYTKKEVLELIGDIEKVHLKKVEDLPEIGEENIIYLIKKPDEEFDNVYNEYIWVDNAYELLSTTKIDLSNYYTKDEIDETNKSFVTTGVLLASLNGYEPKIPNATDMMFQSITYGNHESGYRKWKNGYIEQWGVATSGTNGEVEFTMHHPHIDQNFSIFVEPRERGNFYHYAVPTANQKFACRIQTRDSANIAVRFQWHSYGYWK